MSSTCRSSSRWRRGFVPTYELKYDGTTAEAVRAASDAVARVDPALALFRARTLEVETQESLARERMLAGLTTYFGAFAWLLAGVGLYGLLTCTVTQRTREFGLRLALGASPAGIRRAVLRDSAGTVLVGLLAGVALAFLTVRLIRVTTVWRRAGRSDRDGRSGVRPARAGRLCVVSPRASRVADRSDDGAAAGVTPNA